MQVAFNEKLAAKTAFLNDASLFQGNVNTLLVHGLEGAGAQFQVDKLFKLGHPNTLVAQVRGEETGGIGGDVGTDTTGFLCFTTPVDAGAANRFHLSNYTFTGHKII